MSYSYKCYSDTKEVMKKYVNATEGSIIYGISKTHLMRMSGSNSLFQWKLRAG